MGAAAQREELPPLLTLFDLVEAVAEVADDDREVAAAVLSLLRSGRVALCGDPEP